MKHNNLTINERIRKIRVAKGLKQFEMAQAINMSRTNISRIETDDSPANDRVIALVCMTFGVNEKWLRTGEGRMFDKELDDRLERVIQKFKKLDENSQDFILTQIDLITKYRKKEKKGKIPSKK